MDNGIKLQTGRPPVGPPDYTRLDPLVPKLAHFFGNCFMPCLGLGIIKHSSFAAVDLQLHIIHYHLHIVIHPPFSFFSPAIFYHHIHPSMFFFSLNSAALPPSPFETISSRLACYHLWTEHNLSLTMGVV